jgi:hypothetical protein
VVVVAEVVAVSVEVCAVVVLKVSEVDERLHVAALEAPVGAVTEQLNETVPVNVLAGVTVMVEVPVAPWATVMLPLLVRLKLPLFPPGASQKSPQPAKSGATASNIHAHFPIFIAAPFASSSGTLSQGTACERILSCRPPGTHAHRPNIDLDANQQNYACGSPNAFAGKLKAESSRFLPEGGCENSPG